MSNNERPIPIERFDDDDADIEFRIKSKLEMLSILRGVAAQGAPVTLYYNSDGDFILTHLLAVDEMGMWLDAGSLTEENNQLLLSDNITFVSLHQQIKIQFVTSDIYTDSLEDKEVLYLEMPKHLLRILRREYFRISIPADEPVTCIIPIPPKTSKERTVMREVPILDISGDGCGLLCKENEDILLPEKTFRDCKISIPGIGDLKITVVIRNGFNFTTPEGVVHKRLGCSFILMDSKMNNLLQRYIFKLQADAQRAKARAQEKEEQEKEQENEGEEGESEEGGSEEGGSEEGGSEEGGSEDGTKNENEDKNKGSQ